MRNLSAFYQRQAIAAEESKNWEQLQVLCRRQLAINPQDSAAKFRYALCLESQGDQVRATRIMQQLAPRDRPGYGPAHFWSVRDLLRSDHRLTTDEQLYVQRQLEFAVTGENRQENARPPLANLLVNTGQWKAAVPHLIAMKDSHPESQVQLVDAYRRLGEERLAITTARQTFNFFIEKLRQDPQNRVARMACLQMHVVQGRIEDAVVLASEGLKIEPQGPYQAVLGELYFQMGAAVPITEFTKKLKLLELSLQYAPGHANALTALANLSVLDTPEADQVRERLAQELVEGHAPATVHLILGTHAATHGDVDKAILHLTQAQQMNSRFGVAANNLAFILTQTDPPRLEQALQLANSALQAMKLPEFYETRGQILMKLGRKQEAISDLETALKQFPKRREIHESLAKLYEDLGETQLAEGHRKMLQPPKPKTE